ncbi:MAG: hypothetical protein FWG63_09425 [Defluviitaleaceae bacterium]|nr:hypothetical protein [Defluviitaleaceae bacterium]
MNWSKAQNIAIIAFLILNGVLMLLLHLDSRQYVLASESQMAITTVLNNNNIILASDFSFARHDPIRRLTLLENNFNRNALANVLMMNNNNIFMTVTQNYTKFHNDYEEVRFYENGLVRYTNFGYNNLILETESEKRLFAANLMRNLGENVHYFVLDTDCTTQNGLVLSYRQVYRNNLIYSNFLVFTFKYNGIHTIDFSFNPVYGFLGVPREMRPSDEILLTFAHNIAGYAIINSMDIVHKAQGLTTTPYYRITYTQDGQLRTMLINGYTNSLFVG